jgi:hypothetical protein
MDDAIRLALTAAGAWLLWLGVRRLGKFLSGKIRNAHVREFLTKDRGGY